jgi:hypothetical protein
LGDAAYWKKWLDFRQAALKDDWERIRESSANPAYRPQFVFDTGLEHLRVALTIYSSGASVRDLAPHLPRILDAWEISNRLAEEVCRQSGGATCRDWDFNLANLNHYNWCFWLVGLALCLDTPDEQWHRLLALIGCRERDILLDRVIASRQPDREIGTTLLHPKPYMRLLKAVEAAKEQQSAFLLEFVQHWYTELKRPPPKERGGPTMEPYWHIYGDPRMHPLERGSYFGRWCVEAAAVVKAFGLDDSLCLGHEHYPGDLLRPDGPSTHLARLELASGLAGMKARFARWLSRAAG